MIASCVLAMLACMTATALPAQIRDDFERGLNGWTVYGRGVRIAPSGESAHGHVLVLSPDGDTHALLRATSTWPGVRLEGEMKFVHRVDSYLGFIYGFRQRDQRMDFGLLYLKGDGNYLQANPHFDYNVTRTFYPEHRVDLTEARAVRIGDWHRFRIETVGAEAHLYIGDMSVPAMTFDLYATGGGPVGLQPRSVGGDVWIDNVVATRIDRLAYSGPPIPAATYAHDSLLTDWEVAGPFARTNDDIARGSRNVSWRPAPVDKRGGVCTASVVDYHGPAAVAYFRTTITAKSDTTLTLRLSSVDDLAVWVNGRFHWFAARAPNAWHDVWRAGAHEAREIPIDLHAGANSLVLRVRGGAYAGGGFFAGLVR